MRPFSFPIFLRLYPFEKFGADPETNKCDGAKDECVETETENRRAGQRSADTVNGIGQRIETDDGGENTRQTGQWKKRAGEKEKWHDQKVYNERKALHIVQLGSQHCAESGEEKREQKHKNKSQRKAGPDRFKSNQKCDEKNDNALKHGDRRSAKRPAEHDVETRNRRDQCLFQKAKLLVPDNFNAGKNRREHYGHTNNSGCQKLHIVALAGFGENRAETKAERQQKQNRLRQRSKHSLFGADVSF